MNQAATLSHWESVLFDEAAKDARILRDKGRSFHFASRFLAPAHAEAATGIYGFCRFVDDIADEAIPSKARAELNLIADDLRRGIGTRPQTRRFIALAERIGLDRDIPLRLVEGLLTDLDPVRMPDETALVRYAYKVAGTVGLMMCAALDIRDPRALPFAVDLGIAMQLTNIARDVVEDARMGRRYLPASAVGDLSPAEIVVAGVVEKAKLAQSVKAILDLAERYYVSGEAGLGHLPKRARRAILIAARIYRAIGGQLAGRNHAVWRGRVRVPGVHKIALAVDAMADMSRTPSLNATDAVHDARLHRGLEGLPGTDTRPVGPFDR